MINLAKPNLTGRKKMTSGLSTFAFWTTSVGMVAMTVAFGIAGIAQVYLERKMGLDFMQVQEQVEVHFLGLILAAILFTVGFIAYVIEFIKSGMPLKDITLADKSYD